MRAEGLGCRVSGLGVGRLIGSPNEILVLSPRGLGFSTSSQIPKFPSEGQQVA